MPSEAAMMVCAHAMQQAECIGTDKAEQTLFVMAYAAMRKPGPNFARDARCSHRRPCTTNPIHMAKPQHVKAAKTRSVLSLSRDLGYTAIDTEKQTVAFATKQVCLARSKIVQCLQNQSGIVSCQLRSENLADV